MRKQWNYNHSRFATTVIIYWVRDNITDQGSNSHVTACHTIHAAIIHTENSFKQPNIPINWVFLKLKWLDVNIIWFAVRTDEHFYQLKDSNQWKSKSVKIKNKSLLQGSIIVVAPKVFRLQRYISKQIWDRFSVVGSSHCLPEDGTHVNRLKWDSLLLISSHKILEFVTMLKWDSLLLISSHKILEFVTMLLHETANTLNILAQDFGICYYAVTMLKWDS